MVVVLTALLAATALALGTVLQQRGTLQADGEMDGNHSRGLLADLVRRPVWLLGGLVTAVGGVLQTVALHFGPLMAVQALTSLNLVIALPFGARLTAQRLTRGVWLGAGLVVTGIVLFVSVGGPAARAGTPDAVVWVVAGVLSVGLSALLARVGRGRGRTVQAFGFGAAAGLLYGFQAAVLKEFTDSLGRGLPTVLSSWELYVLIVTFVGAVLVGQRALATGALAPAMAATNASILLSSAALALAVFGERIESGTGPLVTGVVGLALTVLGVLALAGTPAAGPEQPSAPSSAPSADGTSQTPREREGFASEGW